MPPAIVGMSVFVIKFSEFNETNIGLRIMKKQQGSDEETVSTRNLSACSIQVLADEFSSKEWEMLQEALRYEGVWIWKK